jgi:hypothetical protein
VPVRQGKDAKGLDALRSYRRIWDEKLKAYRDTPLARLGV